MIEWVAPFKPRIEVQGLVNWADGRTTQAVEWFVPCQGPACGLSSCDSQELNDWISVGFHNGVVVKDDRGLYVPAHGTWWQFHDRECLASWAAALTPRPPVA